MSIFMLHSKPTQLIDYLFITWIFTRLSRCSLVQRIPVSEFLSSSMKFSSEAITLAAAKFF